MNVLPALENGLFALGQVLRFPVMTLLWVCVAAGLFMAGSCLADLLSRRRERRGFDLSAWLQAGPALDSGDARLRDLPVELRGLLLDVEKSRSLGMLDGGGFEHLVLEREERLRSTLGGPRMLTKVGPSLGLLGTLIPMGSSLAALAAGNLEAMAGQMVVAFTTTIIGIAAGTLAYVVATVRQNWVNQTVREQRYLAERIAAELAREVNRHGSLSTVT